MRRYNHTAVALQLSTVFQPYLAAVQHPLSALGWRIETQQMEIVLGACCPGTSPTMELVMTTANALQDRNTPPVLSILTAAYPPTAEHLVDTAKSVGRLQRLARTAGEQVEWIVVVDGPGDVPPLAEYADVRIIHAPMRGGTSAARNYALAHSTGKWIMPLDHDDLVDGAGMMQALHDAKSVPHGWFVGQTVNVDGSRDVKRKHNPGAVWPPRRLEETWQCPLQFHPNIIVARRELALSVGGWPAIPGVQDLGFVLFLNRHAAGAEVRHCLTHVRRWEKQTTSQEYWLAVKREDFHLLGAIVNAERARHGLEPVSVPDPVLARSKTQYGGLHPNLSSQRSIG